MKKWISIFAVVSLILLLGVSCGVGRYISNKSIPGRICGEGDFLSQVVKCDGNNYVIYKGADQNKFRVVNISKNYAKYEALATVHLGRVYYLYSFKNEAQTILGVEPVSIQKEEQWEVPYLEVKGSFFAVGNTENEILVSTLGNDGRTITEYALSFKGNEKKWRENVVFSLTEEHYAICGAYEGEKLFFVQEDGTVYVRDVVVKEVDVIPQESALSECFEEHIISSANEIWQLSCFKDAMIKCLIPVLLISGFLVLLFYGRRKQNHMIYHLISYSEVICILGLTAAGVLFTYKLTRQEIMETGVETGYILEELKANQRADSTVEVRKFWNLFEESKELLEDIIIINPANQEVIMAKTLTSGMNATQFYDAKIATLIHQVLEGNETVMMHLKKDASSRYVVATRDWTQIDAKAVILGVISGEGIAKRIETAVSAIWNVILFFMMVISILHMIIFLFFASRWNKFLEGMQYVAAEKQAYAMPPQVNDGLLSAWAPLDRIGHNIVKLRYERDLLYRSYYRFVPKNMEKLLGKAEIADVEIGDNNKVSGCLVYFQMKNAKHLSDSMYMNVMTKSLQIMHQIREKYRGTFISAGGDLLNRKIFFEQSATQALRFAIEYYHAHVTKETMNNHDVIMMLHHGNYHYGVSGVEDMMTPFIYCAEEKILDTYMDALVKAKVRIVLTEKALFMAGQEFCVRYIGFLSDEEMKGKVKLYECLDAYTEEKRKVMKESDVYFQNALKLFYSNDFYLARNEFNEVLKIHEQDEIAKWYLFHCEYHLNQPEAEVSYGLFENNI